MLPWMQIVTMADHAGVERVAGQMAKALAIHLWACFLIRDRCSRSAGFSHA